MKIQHTVGRPSRGNVAPQLARNLKTITCQIHLPKKCTNHHHPSPHHKGCWGTTHDFATSFLHFSLFSTALWDLPNLQDGFGQTWWTGDVTIPLQFASLYNRQVVFVWSNCLLDLGMDFLVGSMVFVWDVKYLAVAPHLHGLYSSLEPCCESPKSLHKGVLCPWKGEHRWRSTTDDLSKIL